MNTNIPKCPTCGVQFTRIANPMRCPDVWLECPTCGHVEDMTVDQFYGRAPKPDWANPDKDAK